ncbi:uncharacterized protein LOC114363543 [Ostrinia furnacalis]|uniref:uncharacterized protein LOC114363543 n=1 Tax=Ostrinia furnacalis TaxID=93504 RepID=UPI00103A0FEE|nr:uncharacterized protein LOC114363543 [Ostrinia furnacalis]
MSDKKGVSGTEDVQKLVELINTTDDVELLVKLFSVLAAYLVSNETYKGDIITRNNIYDKISLVLRKSQSVKTVRALNFITALLYLTEEEEGPSRGKSLVLYAQNMIRISGCLLLMCNMFTSCMLHQETWRALCQCLAESCRHSTENQSYCSHLVPMAVQKCIQGNTEAMEILKSLIHNHQYNSQLFVESNGIILFRRRESLLDDTSMQLLSSLVQHSSQEMLYLIHETVFENITYLKNIYGTQNKIGQWATLIWHHLNSRIKVTTAKAKNNDLSLRNNQDITGNNEHSVIDIAFLKPDDTARLLQNVINEIHQYNARNNVIQKMKRHTDEVTNVEQDHLNVMLNSKKIQRNMSGYKAINMKKQLNKETENFDPTSNEMSFSFLLNNKKHTHGKNVKVYKQMGTFGSQIVKHPSVTHNSISNQIETISSDMMSNNILQQDATFLSSALLTHASTFENEDPSLLDFNPIFVSTPKKDKRNTKAINLTKSQNRLAPTKRIVRRMDKTFKAARYSKDGVKPKRDLKNRSMTSRLFNVINDSCTTFVKTVKNIFKSKKSDDADVKNPTVNVSSIEHSCSYSFTDYMRKRDALLLRKNPESIRNSEFNETDNIKSCKTCNDTVSLKYKVNNDHYLKETVTKLKLGINLYGCDFKKISRAMWPRETYMTPEVLYNLYRKLIVK